MYKVQGENFDFHWKKLLSSDNKRDEKDKLGKSSIYDNFVITDLLFCNEKNRDDDEKYRFSQSKSDKYRSYIYHKNIFQNKNIDVISKSLKNTNVIFWANNNSVKFAEKIAKFLILNINNSLIFLLINNLDCEMVLKFNYFIDNFLFIDYKNEYQYIILETESEFYRLILIDTYNDINILDMEPSKIIPSKLNLLNYSNLSVQTYNKEQIIVNLNNNFYFIEIFHPNDIDVPLLHINLNNINSQIFSVITYEKTILLICFENDKFCFKLFSSKLEKSTLMEKSTDQSLEWYNIDFQYLEKFLYTKNIYLTNLIKFKINQDASSTDLISLFDQDISKKLKEKVLKEKINICKAKPMSKNLISILTENSIYVMNVLYNINTEQISTRLEQLDFNYKNLRKFEIFYDSLNLNYSEIYNQVIETISITNNNLVNKEKRLKLMMLTLPSINMFENLIKLYSNSDKYERKIIKSYIAHNLKTKNKITKKEFLYTRILIYLFEKTNNNNLLKNYKNFFIYFENINLIKMLDFFENMLKSDEEILDLPEYQFNPDELQDDKFSIKSLNQLNYSIEEVNISKKNIFLVEDKLVQNEQYVKTLKLTVCFEQEDKKNLLTKALLILFNKKFFKILIFSLLNNKHISKDFEKKIKECEDQKISNFYSLKSNSEFTDYFFKKVSKSLLLLDKITFLKILILKILVYSEKSEKNFLEEVFYFKTKSLTIKECIEVLEYLNKIIGNGLFENISLKGYELLKLTHLFCITANNIDQSDGDIKGIPKILSEIIKTDLNLLDKCKENKYLLLLLNMKFYCFEKMFNLIDSWEDFEITTYISSLEKINSKKKFIFKKISELKCKISSVKSKNDETMKLIYRILNDYKEKDINVEQLCADYSLSPQINLFKFKEILTNIKKNTSN